MSKIKVLIVLTSFSKVGGVPTFINNYFSNYDKDKYDITLVSLNGDGEGYKEFKKIVVTNYKKNYFKFKKEMNNVFKNGNFDVVHSHILFNSYLVLKIAKKNKVPVRINHSHAANLTRNPIRRLGHWLMQKMNRFVVTDRFACGIEAGLFLHGKKFSPKNNEKDYIMYNAIDVDKFKFDLMDRKEIRKKYNVDNKIVLIYVATISSHKNQMFLLDLLKVLDNKYVLFLIGKGKDYNNFKNLIGQKELSNRVFLIGRQENVSSYLSASDIFLFPSLYEGLGLVGIEAQTNGLTVIGSPFIPADISITPLYKSVPLELDLWKTEVEDKKNYVDLNQRNIYFDLIDENNYNINKEKIVFFNKLETMVSKGDKNEKK